MMGPKGRENVRDIVKDLAENAYDIVEIIIIVRLGFRTLPARDELGQFS